MSPQPESTVAHYARATAGVALVVGLIAAGWMIRNILVLLLIAIVLAVGMDPGIRFLQRRFKASRSAATAVILLGALGFLVLFVALVIPPIAREVQQFARRAPDYIDQLQQAGGLLGELEQRFALGEQLQRLAQNAPDIARSSLATVVGLTGAIASGVFAFFTILVLTVYFTTGLPALLNGIASLFPPQRREEYRELMDKATEKIGGYAAGQLTVSLIAGVVAFVGFLIIGLPFPAALAMWVAITTLIPSVGALLGAALSVLVASFVGFGTAAVTLVFMLVYQQIENYVISPRIMKKAVDLSPAAVIISVLIGGSLLGFVGALLALPLAAAAKVVIRDLWLGPRMQAASEKPASTARKPPARPASKRKPSGKPAPQSGRSRAGSAASRAKGAPDS